MEVINIETLKDNNPVFINDTSNKLKPNSGGYGSIVKFNNEEYIIEINSIQYTIYKVPGVEKMLGTLLFCE